MTSNKKPPLHKKGNIKMTLWQRVKNILQVFSLKRTAPATATAFKGEEQFFSPNSDEAIRTVWRCDVTTRGFFKRRTVFKDKLFRCAITRKFLFLQAAFFFELGQFFLGRFLSISEYIKLFSQQGDALSQNVVRSHSRENVESTFGGSIDRSDVHCGSENNKRY